MTDSPVLVLLSAGASSRLGQPKALVDLAGATPLSRLYAAGSASFGDDPLCIAGAHFTEISEAAPTGLEVLLNPNWSDGRTGSVRSARLARPGRDLVIAPVDVPLVPVEVFEQLHQAWIAAGAPARGWLAPSVSVAGKLRGGHPILIGRALAGELDDLESGSSLRLLRDRAEPLIRIEVASERILDDLDTPQDLKNLRTHLESLG